MHLGFVGAWGVIPRRDAREGGSQTSTLPRCMHLPALAGEEGPACGRRGQAASKPPTLPSTIGLPFRGGARRAEGAASKPPTPSSEPTRCSGEGSLQWGDDLATPPPPALGAPPPLKGRPMEGHRGLFLLRIASMMGSQTAVTMWTGMSRQPVTRFARSRLCRAARMGFQLSRPIISPTSYSPRGL